MADELSSAPSVRTLLPGAQALPDQLLSALQRRSDLRDVETGTVLLRQRAVVSELLVLVSGRLTTLVDFGGVGDLVVSSTQRPGRTFGWSGLRSPQRATASVRADAPTRVLAVPVDVVDDGPPAWRAALCEVVTAALADRSRDLERGTPDDDASVPADA